MCTSYNCIKIIFKVQFCKMVDLNDFKFTPLLATHTIDKTHHLN